MFTGIVEEVGTVIGIEMGDGHAELAIAATTVVSDIELGDSVAVDGCCLTVAARTDRGFVADLMAETLRATALGTLVAGDGVNLERAMAATGRFGGHVVQGHVDGVGIVTERVDEPGTTWITVRAPAAVAPYLVPKGSITIAGTSLTVVDVTDDPDGTATFRVGLIPHTLRTTTFSTLAPGQRLNLEADVVGKYVERLVAPHRAATGPQEAVPPASGPAPSGDPGTDAAPSQTPADGRQP
jgi:riboflavin synthase